MEREPAKNAARRRRRRAMLGAGAVCASCGEADSAKLITSARTTLEDHHVFGSANDAMTVTLCRNCHAKVTELQLTSRSQLRHLDDRTILERCEAALRSLAAFLQLLAASLARWADQIGALVVALDRAYPGWRALDRARP